MEGGVGGTVSVTRKRSVPLLVSPPYRYTHGCGPNVKRDAREGDGMENECGHHNRMKRAGWQKILKFTCLLSTPSFSIPSPTPVSFPFTSFTSNRLVKERGMWAGVIDGCGRVTRILKVTKNPGNRGRCRKLSLWVPALTPFRSHRGTRHSLHSFSPYIVNGTNVVSAGERNGAGRCEWVCPACEGPPHSPLLVPRRLSLVPFAPWRLSPKSRKERGMLDLPWLAVELREWFASTRSTFLTIPPFKEWVRRTKWIERGKVDREGSSQLHSTPSFTHFVRLEWSECEWS